MNERGSQGYFYSAAAPINIFLELLVQFLSLILPVILVRYAFINYNWIALTASVLLGLYLYSFAIIIICSLLIRITPKPSLGRVNTSRNIFLMTILHALESLPSRTHSVSLHNIMPFPGKLYYTIAGAKIGKNVTLSPRAIIWNPYFIEIGDNSLIGESCFISGHIAHNPEEIIFGKVKIGRNATIGQDASIFPNVSVGDNSVVATKALVKSDTRIPSNEIWGGVPAKKIKNKGR